MRNKIGLVISLLVLMTTVVFGQAGSKIELTGAGATFPEPFYKKMFDEYNKKTGVKVNYQGIGSGGGIKNLTDKVVDFGATDAFMNQDELTKAGADIIHIPTCIGAVVIVYNLKGVTTPLNLTPEVIAQIFLGKIIKWNDPQITGLNSGIKFPSTIISTVHRSDSSGTSYVFTDYLTKANVDWKDKVGTNKSPKWPGGIGGKGNPGVADLVSKTPGAIGYVELIYALQNKMQFAQIKNKSGNYITPSLQTSSLSANIKMPDDTRVSITDTDVKDGYPISTFTWIILYKEQNYNNRTYDQAKATVDLLWWSIHDGQVNASILDYSPLPSSVVAKAEVLLKSMTYKGEVILK